MNQLVFIQDKHVVTDSLTVAEVFDKSHDKVLRDIRNLDCSKEFLLANFGESTYYSRGKEYPMFFIKQDGFSFLVMGYTGKKAAQFKEQYINQFNQMRQQIENSVKVLSEREQRMESMRLTLETAEKQEIMDSRLSVLETKVEEQITLYHGEQRRLQRAVGSKVYSLTIDKEERKRLFSELHRELKDRFGVSSYKDIKRKDLQTAINYIENWIPRKVS